MASKSTGQIIGTIAGAVIGFFTGGAGYVALGAALGGMAGGLIDPPKGPTIAGPRLDDLSFQTSTLGAPLGRSYGTVPVLGNVVWLEGDAYREVITSEEQGGKGGGGATYETARYYATFAVSLLRVTDATKTVALRRMWIGSNLVYDAGSDDLESIIASNSQSALFTFYGGSDDQQPNTRWQADKGVNAVSGFPGRCYIVIYDLDLEPYSRSLAMAQVKVELAVSTPTIETDVIETIVAGNLGDPVWGTSLELLGVNFTSGGCSYITYEKANYNGAPISLRFGGMEFPYKDETASFDIVSPEGGYGYAWDFLYCCQSDEEVSLQKQVEFDGYFNIILRWFYQGVQVRWSSYLSDSRIPYSDHSYFVLDRGETFLAGDNSTAYIVKVDQTGYVLAASVSEYSVRQFGASENYIFALLYTPGADNLTTTVYKFDRITLELTDTYTQDAVGGRGTIHVISDSLFYTAAWKSGYGGHLYRWVDGVVVEDSGNIFPDGIGSYSRLHVVSEAPLYGYLMNYVNFGETNDIFVFYSQVASSVAKLRDIVTSECGLAGVSSGDIDLTALTNSDVRGYRIANLATIRSSLEMLQAAFPFDVAPSGYKLRFVSRGGASLATIPETDLGATAGGETLPVLLPMSREMDTQIPYKVSIRYLDQAREYDISEQYASRPDTASVSERTVELSLVLTGDDAVQAADVLNQKDWLERASFGPFSLPPTWRILEPPDIVTVEHRGQAHTVRLTRAEFLPDGRIECAGVYSSAQSYTSSATAQESLTVGQSLVPLAGSTDGYLLDIPRIRSEQDVPGMAYGLTGLASGWPGGVLLRSDDSGNSWLSVAATNSRAKVFVAGAALAEHHGYTIDNGAVITVTAKYPGHTLSSVTEDQLYAHTNLAAYGIDGRWEIVSFQTVTDNTGSYTINGFIRGLYGTEWATSLHVSGDLLIMLDTTTIGFFGLPTNALGSARLYRAVTQGASVDSAEDATDTYDAENLKPLSPIDGAAWRNEAGDWIASSDRRTRWPVEVFSGVAVPLGETSAAYELDIYDDDTFAVVKRTITGLTSEQATYSAAMQISDFGVVQASIYFGWRQLSSFGLSSRTLPCTASQSFVTDEYWDNVVLLLKMNGTNNGTTFTDERGHTIVASGGFVTKTDVYLFGSASGYSDGDGDYLTASSVADLSPGASDFCVEGFFRPNGSQSGNRFLFDARVSGGNSFMVWCAQSSFANSLCYSTEVGTGFVSGGGWTDLSFNHWAVTRQSGTVRGFMRGTKVFETTDSRTMGSPQGYYIASSTSAGQGAIGNHENIRVTVGQARYTSDFTPPSTDFPTM